MLHPPDNLYNSVPVAGVTREVVYAHSSGPLGSTSCTKVLYHVGCSLAMM